MHTSSHSAGASAETLLEGDRAADSRVRLLDAVLRAVDPETAGRLAASILEGELVFRDRGPLPRKAAELAGELRLTRAIPALVHGLEHLPDANPLIDCVRAALGRLGPASAPALLDAFHRWTSSEIRLRLAGALLDTKVRSDGIFRALVELLDDDPSVGPEYVMEYGGPDAVDVLSRGLDRAVLEPDETFDIFTNENVCVLAWALRKLGGSLSSSQQAKLDEVVRRRDAAWARWEKAHPLPKPIERRPVPARNAPCHCGSGRKYKKCHLPEEETALRALSVPTRS